MKEDEERRGKNRVRMRPTPHTTHHFRVLRIYIISHIFLYYSRISPSLPSSLLPFPTYLVSSQVFFPANHLSFFFPSLWYQPISCDDVAAHNDFSCGGRRLLVIMSFKTWSSGESWRERCVRVCVCVSVWMVDVRRRQRLPSTLPKLPNISYPSFHTRPRQRQRQRQQ